MTTNPVMSITDEQIAEIEALANDALPGGWHVENGMGMVYDSQMDFVCDTSEDEPCRAAHIAEASPDSILAIISRLRAAERDAARRRKARDILTVEAIETAQSDFINFGLPAAESESLRADQAIDAAMKGEQQ